MEWKQIKYLLLKVLDQPPSQRVPFLEAQCQDNEKLKLEILSLLEMDSEAKDFFSTSSLSRSNVANEVLGVVTRTGIEIDKQPALRDYQFATADSKHTRTEVLKHGDWDSLRVNVNLNPFSKEEQADINWQGRTLGDFILQEKFSEGGFGQVYRAEQPSLGREAVIKILHAKYHNDADIVERFRREAKLASRLEHPYAAHIYDFGIEADGLIWIAMELVHGTPLNKILRTQGTMALERFIPLFDKICEVVHTAHDYGIVHRDIKPANIMVLTRAGRMLPKLLDFGIAKDLSSGWKSFEFEDEYREAITLSSVTTGNTERLGRGGVTEISTKVIGSPHYMAPEQWENGILTDSRTDIYALGVLAYECLSGEPPFMGDTRELYEGHMKKNPPSLGSKYPEAVNLALLKALAKKPSDRYATALEFSNQLHSAIGLNETETTLPQLNETIRQDFITIAPQPIAEVLANFGTARNIYQAKEQLLILTQLILRYLGVLTLSCRIQLGSGNDKDSELVIETIKKLIQKGLKDEEWLELMQELTRPFLSKKDAYPIPELVTLFFGRQRTKDHKRQTRFNELIADVLELNQLHNLSEEDLQALMVAKLHLVELILVKLAFLGNYTLVVIQHGHLEHWVGLGRIKDPLNQRTSSHYPEEQPLIINREGALILSLWPLAQIYKPTPTVRDELFLLEGRGRNGAKLVALPTGFEHQDEKLWEVFSNNFFGLEKEGAAASDHKLVPYLGLSPFSSNDINIFFGRERETERFLNRLQVETLIAVVGPSGAGKSSFVQAGIIPALPANAQVITLRPGANPWLTLETHLAALGLESKELMRQVKRSGESLGKILTKFAQKQQCKIFLVVDQFEEIFTLCLDEEARQLFGIALSKAVRTATDPVRIILTLRDDFLIRTKDLPSLGEQLNYELLTTPKLADLVRILTEPARKVGYEFEDDELPLEMAQAVAERRGSLPLLAFTAAKLWDLRDRALKQLKRKTYEAMGGVGGALAGHAEETLNQMTQQEQKMVREIFRRLVTSEGTRAVITRPELYQILGQEQTAKQVLEHLINKRLLATHEGEDSSERIEIIHEALINAWPRLVNWRQEDAEGAKLRDQLRAAAKQWQERNYPKGLLWRDEALTEYQLWRAHYPGKLTEIEEEFGLTSISEASRSQRIRRNLVITSMIILLAVSGVMFYQREQTQQQFLKTLDLYEEQARQEMLKGNLDGAAVYLSEAYAKGSHSLALKYMLSVALAKAENHPPLILANHTDAVMMANFSPDDQMVVTASADKTARIWQAIEGKELFNLKGHEDAVVSAEFSPDGQQVVTSSLDKTARIWQVSDGSLVAVLTGHTDGVNLAKFSPNGKQVVTISYDKTAKIWDVTTGKLLNTLAGHQGGIYAVSYSRDSQLIATAGADKVAKIWNSQTGELINTLTGHQAGIVSIAFNPSSNLVVTGSMDKTAKLWQVADGKLLYTLAEHESVVRDAKFSPEGDNILTTSGDKRARLWDTKTGKLINTLEGHKDDISSGEFSPNGKLIITSSRDKTTKVWERATGKFLVALTEGDANLSSGVFSHSSNKVLIASEDKTAKIWKVEAEERLPDEVSRIVKEKVPSHLEEGRLVATGIPVSNLVTTAAAEPNKREGSVNSNILIEELDNGIKIEMLPISGGTFDMGSPQDEKGHAGDEVLHKVTVAPFYLGRYEVTQAQWQAVAALPTINRFLTVDPAHFKGDNLPVESVSWDEAEEFCARLSKLTGKEYRLPTEAEWEYAARAGSKGAYAGELDEMAWYEKTSDKKTHNVGEKKPNAWGLYDMTGNVWEWCSDWYGEYPNSDVVDPKGASLGSARVFRGSGWFGTAASCRTAYRDYITHETRGSSLGFRLARTLK